MRTYLAFLTAVTLLGASCHSKPVLNAAAPPFELTDCAGAGRSIRARLSYESTLPGYRLQVPGNSYGTLWFKPTGERHPRSMVFVFLEKSPGVFSISNADKKLVITADSTSLLKTVARGGAVISRDPIGLYVDIQKQGGEVHVVLLPKAMQIVRQPFCVHWGIPR